MFTNMLSFLLCSGGTCQADGEEVEEEEEECVSLERENMSKEILQRPKEEEEQEEEELRIAQEEIGDLCLKREETFRENEQDKEVLNLPEEVKFPLFTTNALVLLQLLYYCKQYYNYLSLSVASGIVDISVCTPNICSQQDIWMNTGRITLKFCAY